MLSISLLEYPLLFKIGLSKVKGDSFVLTGEAAVRRFIDSENKLVGLITLTDLLASTDSRLRDRDERLRASEIRVEEVMTTDVATVDQHASLRNAALFLEKHKIGCLPVVTGDTLRGIITDTDFVAVAINLLEQLEINEPDDDFEEI